MRITWYLAHIVALAFLAQAAAPGTRDDKKKSDSGKKEEEELKPCTVRSPNTGSFFDLNPIHITLPDPDKKTSKESRNESWHARGYDYGANFTINFCGGVVETLENVVGIDKVMYRNISAFYKKDGKTYSIGQNNQEPVFRGRKLVLNYTHGSPCPISPNKRAVLPQTQGHRSTNLAGKNIDDSHPNSGTSLVKAIQAPVRRKSTVISLLCERDPLAAKAAVAFVGASEDECSYFFELRSSAACPSVNVETQQVGPSGVFGIIAGVAILVYIVGGIVYQRAVMHQRGWRQLPNYSLWAGMISFVKDMFIILFHSCMRCIPRRRGYNQVNGPNGTPPSVRRSLADDENRMIDQLDEEWDD